MSAAALIASSASGLDRAAVADLHAARAFARDLGAEAWVFAIQADGSWQLVGRVPLGEAARCLRVRQAREQAGLSVAQAARILGADAAILTALEADEPDAPAEILPRLADVCGVDLAWLSEGVCTPAAEAAARRAEAQLASAGVSGANARGVAGLVRSLKNRPTTPAPPPSLFAPRSRR